jgi:hypothetical protein
MGPHHAERDEIHGQVLFRRPPEKRIANLVSDLLLAASRRRLTG